MYEDMTKAKKSLTMRSTMQEESRNFAEIQRENFVQSQKQMNSAEEQAWNYASSMQIGQVGMTPDERAYVEKTMPLFTSTQKMKDKNPLTDPNGKISDEAIEAIGVQIATLKERLLEFSDEGREEYKTVCRNFEIFSQELTADKLKQLQNGDPGMAGATANLMHWYEASLQSAINYVSARPFWKLKGITTRAKGRKKAAAALRDSLSSGPLSAYLSQLVPMMAMHEVSTATERAVTEDMELSSQFAKILNGGGQELTPEQIIEKLVFENANVPEEKMTPTEFGNAKIASLISRKKQMDKLLYI